MLDPAILNRPRLIDRMVTDRTTPVVLLQAPAGYSKSTCLALWDAADSRTFCWLSCRARHDDPAVLVAAIVEAMDPVQPVGPEVLLALSAPTPDMETVRERLSMAIQGTDEPFVLVIDDAHLLTMPETADVLTTVLESLPAGSQLAIGTRTRPALALGRLRAGRLLSEYGPADLAMTRRESSDLLATLDVELEATGFDDVFERTEGWPAALYLAGLVLQAEGSNGGDHGVPGPKVGFSGNDRIVVEYFREEFFNGLSDDQAKFLYRTSILEELNGPLCDALTASTGSAGTLVDLARSNAMVIPLDRADTRFRYHHLFSDMLRSELRLREPGAEKELHRRASLWYRDQGEIESAVTHAIASDDTDLAGEMFWIAWPELSGRGGMATLERWMEELGEPRVLKSTPLVLGKAHDGLLRGDGGTAIHWIEIARRQIQAGGQELAKYQGDLDVLDATLSLRGVEQMVSDARSAISLLDPKSPWVTPAYLYAGVGLHLAGNPDKATPDLEEAVRRGASATPIIQVLALCQLAMIAEPHRWSDAERLISQARRQVEICGLSSYASMSMVIAMSAYQRARDGRADEARLELGHCRQLLSEMNDFPSWYEAEVRLTMARACLRLGDPAPAEALVGEARRFAAATPGAPVLAGWIEDVAAALEGSRDGMLASRTNLTKSELRTLQFLPSHHSFRAIGEQLHLSQNTVKTQANSLYRKLGATSRAEAVMIARKAGLLDEVPE